MNMRYVFMKRKNVHETIKSGIPLGENREHKIIHYLHIKMEVIHKSTVQFHSGKNLKNIAHSADFILVTSSGSV